MESKYSIGTIFKTRGKSPKTCKVIDIHYTKNSKNELIKIKYVAIHEFLGQTVTDYEVSEITITMGLINKSEF